MQSTIGVRTSHPVDAAILSETLACLEEDMPTAGIKIGMLGTTAAVDAVTDFLHRLRGRGSRIPVVIDPVLRASSGRELLDPGAALAMRTRLLPLADWVTPNMDELVWLTTMPAKNRLEMEAAAEKLQREIGGHGGRINVLAKGGDLGSPDDFVLMADGQTTWLPGERVETTATHGTGCALSSALLCRLVLGETAAVGHAGS